MIVNTYKIPQLETKTYIYYDAHTVSIQCNMMENQGWCVRSIMQALYPNNTVVPCQFLVVFERIINA